VTNSTHVVIVGGGASGVLLACHLLRDSAEQVLVTLIEKSASIGRGIAYGTANPAHLLNVRAANMSAFTDDPGHFWRWLQENRLAAADSDQFCFVSRQIYGRYIEGLLQQFRLGSGGKLRIVQGECIAIAETPAGVAATFKDGTSLPADIAILATGNETCQSRDADDLYASPWKDPAEAALPNDGHVLILGTGLTMIDYVQSLLHRGHRGQITAISRHGLLPRPHRPVVAFAIDRADVPFGCDIAELLRWCRRTTRKARQQGSDWRGVVDGIRPFTQELWQRLPLVARQRFLRHARTWWDVHRHRMAPEVEQLIGRALASGQFAVKAGKVQSVEARCGVAQIAFRPRGFLSTVTLEACRIVECTGINPIPHSTSNPVLRSLFDHGLARIDALGIGLDSTDTCALIDRSGKPSQKIFAIGPLTRAAVWEIVAIPDIRAQCHRLAEHIRSQLLLS
jgi:uncharacterized NAD(P)/FAD-binding protein YdhS